MTGLIWIFQGRLTGGLIARREPYYYQSVMDNALGEEVLILTMGEVLVCPVWERVWSDGNRRFGSYSKMTFDISHLSATTSDGGTTIATGATVTTGLTTLTTD